MELYYTDQFEIPLPDGHRFPMPKFRLLRQRVEQFEGIAAHSFHQSPLSPIEDIERAHSPGYISKVVQGTLTPAEQRRIGFPWSSAVVERARRACGGTTAALAAALKSGGAVHLAGGTHHACRSHGEGYCVFNDVAVAAYQARANGMIRRALVVDLDVHQGNGTAEIMTNEEWCYTFSMHAAKNYPFRKVASDCDIDLADATADDEYLETLAPALDHISAVARPDVVFYTSGADAHINDSIGRLALSKEGLAVRDRMVIDLCRKNGIPYVVTMAGGYGRDIHDTIDIHAATVFEALQAS
jgi:acetoin utilization deacetylase AcuC-like enzyme